MYSLTILCLSVTLPYVYFYSMHYTIESISNILYSIVEYLDSVYVEYRLYDYTVGELWLCQLHLVDPCGINLVYNIRSRGIFVQHTQL